MIQGRRFGVDLKRVITDRKGFAGGKKQSVGKNAYGIGAEYTNYYVSQGFTFLPHFLGRIWVGKGWREATA